MGKIKKRTRGQIKREIKNAIEGTSSFEDMINSVTIYIIDNYKLRDKPIDSTKILLKLKKKKRKHKNE